MFIVGLTTVCHNWQVMEAGFPLHCNTVTHNSRYVILYIVTEAGALKSNPLERSLCSYNTLPSTHTQIHTGVGLNLNNPVKCTFLERVTTGKLMGRLPKEPSWSVYSNSPTDTTHFEQFSDPKGGNHQRNKSSGALRGEIETPRDVQKDFALEKL